jgi:hypothetical protein
MLQFADAQLAQLIIHYAGNKNNQENYVLSDRRVGRLDPETQQLMVRFFLAPFKTAEQFRFWHESDIQLNPCFSFLTDIFEDPEQFTEKSKSLCRHLYECTMHPQIKPGDLFMAELTDVQWGEQTVSAVVIVKSENKETFVQSQYAAGNFDLQTLAGIRLDKIDKAALILHTEAGDGFRVCVVDNVSRGSEAAYWRDDFLKIVQVEDAYYHTSQMLGIAKEYITGQFSKEFQVTKTDRIDLLNRSLEYFKTHDAFDKEEFEEEVFHHPEMIDSFRSFDQQFRQERGLEMEASFDISDQAVKKQARVFKSVLKLDRNFHVYIHGNRQLIERGVDEDGRKYYKLYYEEES